VIHTIPVSFSAIGPEIILLVTAAVLLVTAIFLPDEPARVLSAAATTGALVAATIYSAAAFHDHPRAPFDHTLRIDAFGQGGRMLVFVAALVAVAISWGIRDLGERSVEYHVLLLAASAGMSLLCVANSFVTGFVALELFSLALYILVAIETDDLRSLEGALKYLIIGSIGAAFLLYGAALTYGASGQLEFDRIRAGLAQGDSHDVLALMGLTLVIVGLGFKANAAPFHMWTPDAYEGAPTPVTAFMSAATKVVALVFALRVLVTAFPAQSDVWQIGLAGIIIASFAVGNLGALRQSNVKRMLAYSTVGHSGFLLTAVAAHSALGTRALLYYLTVYGAMNLGAFGIVAVREREIGRPVQISDFAGWGYRRPLLGVGMLICMLSLAGFPPTGGFLGKLYVFSAAAENGQAYLAVAGVIATMVGLVYYLRVPFALYDRDAVVPKVAAPAPGFGLTASAATLAALAALVLGIVPTPLIDLARTAGSSLFG
jgi:NADH-quinone oxidoreductase subunit N